MSKLADCVIGMGANLGDRLENMQRAVHEIARFCQVRGVSSLYETDPVGPPQPVFLNAALRVTCDLTPPLMLARLLDIERQLGRIRLERWGPRTLDLDILWIEGTHFRSRSLTVPHARLLERAFAVLPLLEVAPDAIDPATGIPVSRQLDMLDTACVRCLRDPGWVGFEGVTE